MAESNIKHTGYTGYDYANAQGITSYTSAANAFTIPKNGVISLGTDYADSNAHIYVQVILPDGTNGPAFRAGDAVHGYTNQYYPIFANHKVYVSSKSTKSTATFIPFK